MQVLSIYILHLHVHFEINIFAFTFAYTSYEFVFTFVRSVPACHVHQMQKIGQNCVTFIT